MLKGNYVAQELVQGDATKKYTLVPQNDDNIAFSAFDGTTNVKANQCWLECDMPEVNKFVLCFGEVTDIHDIPMASPSNSILIYNIAGQLLREPQAGLNIVGNKKVLIQ